MRPSVITQDVISAICEHIADGRSMREICRMDGMPAMSTVFKHLALDAQFAEQYARAKSAGIEAMAEEILDIADNARNDWMERNGGDEPGWSANGENVRRAQLRIDSRKWLLAKLAPKKYGDKVDVAHSGDLTINWPVPPSRVER